jgi:hypothetical protein
LIFC